MSKHQGLCILARSPQLGKVKTRLAADIGTEEALEVYLDLLEHTLTEAMELSISYKAIVYRGKKVFFQNWQKEGFKIKPQIDGDLGERLASAAEQAFDGGVEQLIIIGSDCPYLTKEHLEGAFTALNSAEVVLGPAKDGGYWLIGMNSLDRRLFEDIHWSSDKVTSTTIQKLEQLGLSYQLLEELDDIDTETDYENWLSTKRA